MKKIICIVCSICILTSIIAFAKNNVKVIVDETEVIFDQAPVIRNGTTLVPLRAIFEALGADVEWDNELRIVMAWKRFDVISIKIGERKLYKNGETIELNAPAEIINGRTLVPVRAISESFGAEVFWDNVSKTVTVKSKQGDHFITDSTLKGILKDPSKVNIGNITIKYPQIKNDKNLNGISKINEFYQAEAKKAYDECANMTLEIFKEFDSQVDKIKPFVFIKRFEIPYNKNNMISVVEIDSQDTGGAHPNYLKTANSFDVKTGEIVSAEKILGCTKEEVLKMIEETFYTMITEEPENFFPDAKENLKESVKNAQFYLKDDQIVFFLNTYEIAPYAYGCPEFSISINTLKTK